MTISGLQLLVNAVNHIDTNAACGPVPGSSQVSGEHDELLEGAWPGAIVLMEFPDRNAANAWYHSPAYQEILRLRTDNAVSDVILVDQVASDFTSAGFAEEMRAAQAPQSGFATARVGTARVER